jgi:hypothetical protein
MNQENGTVIASARGRVAPLIVALAALVAWLLVGIWGTQSEADAQATGQVFIGAGDIASAQNQNDLATGNIIRQQLQQRPDLRVFTLGDNAYPQGTLSQYRSYYDPTWGSFAQRTRPVPGNHQHLASQRAQGYFDYFVRDEGLNVGEGVGGYYSRALGADWRTIALNSVNTEGPSDNQAPACGPGSAQLNFLNRQLANADANGINTIVYWHHARFSNSADHPTSEGRTGCSRYFFDAAVSGAADIVLVGHSHVYERFSKRNASGARVAGVNGVTQFTVGTGGASHDVLLSNKNPVPDAENNTRFGVLKLTLRGTDYSWDFLAVGGSIVDSGTESVNP